MSRRPAIHLCFLGQFRQAGSTCGIVEEALCDGEPDPVGGGPTIAFAVVWARIQHGACNPTWSGPGFDKRLTFDPPTNWPSSHLRGIILPERSTLSSLTGRTGGLLIESTNPLGMEQVHGEAWKPASGSGDPAFRTQKVALRSTAQLYGLTSEVRTVCVSSASTDLCGGAG